MNTESQKVGVKRGMSPTTLTRPADTLSRSRGRGDERGASGEGTSNIQQPTPNIQWGKAGQDGEFLSKKELATRLSVNLRTIERWQHDGLVPYIKVGSVVLFNWTEVLAHLNAKYRVAGSMVTGGQS